MTRRLRCGTCLGEYDADHAGVPYLHACPPVRDHAADTEAERLDKRDENPIDVPAHVRQDPAAFLGFVRAVLPSWQLGDPLPPRAPGRGVVVVRP